MSSGIRHTQCINVFIAEDTSAKKGLKLLSLAIREFLLTSNQPTKKNNSFQNKWL